MRQGGLLLGLGAGIGALVLMLGPLVPAEALAFVIALPLAACASVAYPEIVYALFLTAGVYKTDERLAYSLPVWLDLTVLLGLLCMLGTVIRGLARPEGVGRPAMRVCVGYGILLLAGLASLSFTPAPVYGGDKLARLATITALALFLPFSVCREHRRVVRFLGALVVLGMLMVGDAVSVGLVPGADRMGTAFGSNHLALGRVTGLGALVALFLWFARSRAVVSRVLAAAAAVWMVFGALLAGGRGPVLSLAAALVVAMGCTGAAPAAGAGRHVVRRVAPAALGLGIGVVLASELRDYLGAMFMKFGFLMTGGGDSALERVSMYTKALELMANVPQALWGIGIGGFTVAYTGIDAPSGEYPHNIFLEAGAELGVVGLTALVALVYWAFAAVVKMTRDASEAELDLAMTLLAAMVFVVGNSLVSGDLNDNRLLFAFVGVVHAVQPVAESARSQPTAADVAGARVTAMARQESGL